MKIQRSWRMEQKGNRETTAVRAMYWIMTALLIGIVLALLLVPAKAKAGDLSIEQRAEHMEKLAVLAAYAVIDYRQSCEMFYSRAGYYENNPILGPHPSRASMAAFGVAGMGLTYIAGEILPDPWATVVLDSVIASEQYNIEENARVEAGQQRRISGVPIIISIRF